MRAVVSIIAIVLLGMNAEAQVFCIDDVGKRYSERSGSWYMARQMGLEFHGYLPNNWQIIVTESGSSSDCDMTLAIEGALRNPAGGMKTEYLVFLITLDNSFIYRDSVYAQGSNPDCSWWEDDCDIPYWGDGRVERYLWDNYIESRMKALDE